ncbi:hypothetical protein VNI00_014704 [Paramarasmius palmivorus]|uniref:Uncharacterized protein n=1 Tax=Paramarasmius palmivorus TaxID=297713 RepID=A0AAW0BR62_9AGAR
MPSDSSSSATTASRKPSTRSSIRQSLNFASVGKAFADVMNKEGRERGAREAEKSAKKSVKESHRSSIGLRGLAPRPSLDKDARPSPPPTKRPRTPDSKTITARRRSSMAQHAQGASLDASKSPDSATPQNAPVSRTSTLRPRSGTSSGLPKYRPKSIIASDPTKKPGSPSLIGARKRPSVSEDDDDKDDKEQMKPSGEKSSRAISPLPHRAAFKVNLTNLAPTPSPNPKHHSKPSTPTSTARSSPTRLVKHTKAASSIIRPPSSASSSSSVTPRTPKSSPARNDLRSTKSKSSQRGNVTDSSDDYSHPSHPGIQESPLVRHVRQRSKAESPAIETNVGNMSHISEADSEDMEEADVEMLLAPVASIGAPTPAMPRIQTTRTRQRLAPQTPCRPTVPREVLMPPDNDSPSSLRLRTTPASEKSAPRGSILSWEQFASEASKTLDEEEIGTVLSDITAPFQGAPLSPMPTGDMLLPPESPCLSALNSPSGYGSISHVLLPTVTPSPALPRTRFRESSPSNSSGEAAVVTLLRLQLSSAENIAKERLMQLQLLEEEVHNLKQARGQDAQELARKLEILEEQMRDKLEAEARSAEQVAAHIALLEGRLRKADVAREEAVKYAVESATRSVHASSLASMKTRHRRLEAAHVSENAAREWRHVKELCEGELEDVQRDKELMTFLLAELDLAQEQIREMDA